MEQTTNYDIFKSITSNREVNNSHVRTLVKAISKKNLLHLNPVICNSSLEVIDGQHRLEAAKFLGVPVFYIVDNNIGKADIANINSNSKNWSIMDYINFWTVEKAKGFDKLSSFISENPEIKPSTCITLISSDSVRDTKSIKEGHVNVLNFHFATEVAKVLKFFRNYYENTYESKFIMALTDLMGHPDFKLDNLKLQVENQPRSLVRCVSRKQYLEMLLDIYNYKLSKNRLNF